MSYPLGGSSINQELSLFIDHDNSFSQVSLIDEEIHKEIRSHESDLISEIDINLMTPTRRNISNKPKHVAGPTVHKVQFLSHKVQFLSHL